MQGGAIFCEFSSPVISYNVIARNIANGGGGGIYFGNSSSPVISHNTIFNNGSNLVWWRGAEFLVPAAMQSFRIM